MARQAARSVLPNATETMIFVTANARALRHFIELRGSEGAEAEIRRVALEFLRIMQREAPNLFADYEIVTLPDGREVTSHAEREGVSTRKAVARTLCFGRHLPETRELAVWELGLAIRTCTGSPKSFRG